MVKYDISEFTLSVHEHLELVKGSRPWVKLITEEVADLLLYVNTLNLHLVRYFPIMGHLRMHYWLLYSNSQVNLITF